MNGLATSEIRLFDDRDMPWIGSLLDLISRSLGQPWRVLLERVEQADFATHPSRVQTVLRAMRRMTGGKAERKRVARDVRALVLGQPALDCDARDIRLAVAGAQLGIPPAEVESLLWADLALERPVVLPSGRPPESTLIAHANLDRIQRAVRRARSVQIRAWDRANELVRTVARYGLIAHISRGSRGETLLDVTGPLALFHTTTVYGSALAQLVPLLAEQQRFELDVVCEYDGIEEALRVEPPLRLPAVRPSRRAPSVAERLARDLEKAKYVVEREPAPLAASDELVFPDLAVEIGGPDATPLKWFVEIVGFSTAEYLAYKLERYQAAGIERVVLCVDAGRAAELLDHPRVIPFAKRVDATKLVEQVGASRLGVTP
jgi:predicted nuclease of restriction endonuclease-like RecB superfamily